MGERTRIDRAQEKRVELRLHTNYSAEDVILDVGAAIRRAKAWGMNSLAVTDHLVVQAFPDATYFTHYSVYNVLRNKR